MSFKEKLNQDVLAQAAAHMQSVLDTDQDRVFIPTHGHPVYRALQIIGEQQGLTFQMPSDLDDTLDLESWVEGICEASQVIFRKIELSGFWWQELETPLLLVTKDKKKLLCVLPQRQGAAQLVEHDGNILGPITMDRLKGISSWAFAFSERFADEPIGFYDLVKVSLSVVKKELMMIAFIGLVISVVHLFNPVANQLLFDVVVPDNNIDLYWQLIIALAVTFLVTSGLGLIQSLVSLRMQGLVEARLRVGMWDRLLRLPAPFFRRYATGDLIQRVQLVDQTRQMLTGQAIQVMISSLFSMVYVVAMLRYSWKLTAVGVGFLLVSLAMSCVGVVLKIPLVRRVMHLGAWVNAFLVQVVGGVSQLRIGAAEERAFQRWASVFSKLQKYVLRGGNIDVFLGLVQGFIPLAATAATFIVAVRMIEDPLQGLSVGQYLGFQAAFTPLSQSISVLVGTVITLVGIVPLWERAQAILRESPEPQQGKKVLRALDGAITASNLCFKYPGKQQLVVDGVSFRLERGDFLAICGSSGSGKSTLLRLLLGLDSLSCGIITYNGHVLDSLDLRALRRKIGVVTQSQEVFAGTVSENILLGRPCSSEQVKHALQVSCFDEVLSQLPMGLDTPLSSGGDTLSGGQRQRLLIARALVSEPQILFLDEATSYLDALTQEKVMKHLVDMKITMIVVAHRLSTLRAANHLIVLDKGKVVQEGEFQSLIATPGPLRHLMELSGDRYMG